MNSVKTFNVYREKMNKKILSSNNKIIKRIFNLYTNTFSDGTLSVKTKEMLGLAYSMVLRCDDCIKYHLGKCRDEGLTNDEVYEVFAIASLIGGTIVIPTCEKPLNTGRNLSLQININS